MAKPKFVKLGEKANSFYDPTTGFKLAKNQVKELDSKMQASRKIKNALKHSFLENAEEGEFDNIEVEAEDVKIYTEAEDVKIYTEAELMAKSKEALVNLAVLVESQLPEDERSTPTELSKMTKAELAEIVLDSQEDEEEE